jgi:hypothetical protein
MQPWKMIYALGLCVKMGMPDSLLLLVIAILHFLLSICHNGLPVNGLGT